MKKIVASVGLVALGASGIQTVSAQTALQPAPDTSKPWNISATLRGFYDDNTATMPNNATLPAGMHRGSFGFEVSPSAALNYVMEQTTINLGVLYSLEYYDNKPPFDANHYDQVFTFSGGLTHRFSEQLKASINDSFVIGQEPDLLRAGNTFATFQRVSGDNIRNYGSANLDAQLTPKVGLGLGFDNAYYDYKDTGASSTIDPTTGLDVVNPSIAGALNRMEDRVHLEALYELMPETKALIGYQFTDVDYTQNEPISGYLAFPGTIVYSRARDYREHTGYLGLEHNFLPNLTGSLRVGASYSDYYNDPTAKGSYTPYVNMTLRYTYSPQSYVEAGFSYDRNATDVVGLLGAGTGLAQITLDAESAVVYATINHHIVGNLFGNLMAQFQNSTYNGGEYNNVSEQYYLLGLDLQYRFNQYFSADAGYDYDNLQSPTIGRTFDRNRVYIGVTASY